MKGIVDRIEGGTLVLEVDNDYLEFDLTEFPNTIREGDIVINEGGKFLILVEETKKRTKKMEDLLESLFRESED